MKTLTLGLLLPSSSILPMGKDFERGVKRGMQELMNDETWQVEVVPEFIGQGAYKRVDEAVGKLFSYDGVDMIVGIVSHKVAQRVAEKFEKNRKPFLINNIGEHLPDPSFYNPYILLNSTHSWQQLWSLGNWAIKKFGSKGMFVGSLYESGYSFLSMMKMGMMAADPECKLPFAVAPLPKEQKMADPRAVFSAIEEQQPDFIFSFFCGEEASIFLEEYIRAGYHKKIPLIGLPFLLESFNAGDESVEIYTAVSSYAEKQPGDMNGTGTTMLNPFPELGYETGKLIAEAVRKANGANLHQALKEVSVETGRGVLNVNGMVPGEKNRVYLVKNTHTGDQHKINKEILQELPSIEITDPAITKVLKEASSAWENPYLGI